MSSPAMLSLLVEWSAGTSEIALALKGNKKVILLKTTKKQMFFFQNYHTQNVYVVDSPSKQLKLLKTV